MTKKHPSSITYRDKDQDPYDHSALESLLEERKEVLMYFRDGESTYLVIGKSYFDMGTCGNLNIGALIRKKLPYYNVVWNPQRGHSGHVWRDVFQISGGMDKEYGMIPRVGKWYVSESKECLDEDSLDSGYGKYLNCTFCGYDDLCSWQGDKDGKPMYTCDKCFDNREHEK